MNNKTSEVTNRVVEEWGSIEVYLAVLEVFKIIRCADLTIQDIDYFYKSLKDKGFEIVAIEQLEERDRV